MTDRSANWLWNVDNREYFHQGDESLMLETSLSMTGNDPVFGI